MLKKPITLRPLACFGCHHLTAAATLYYLTGLSIAQVSGKVPKEAGCSEKQGLLLLLLLAAAAAAAAAAVAVVAAAVAGAGAVAVVVVGSSIPSLWWRAYILFRLLCLVLRAQPAVSRRWFCTDASSCTFWKIKASELHQWVTRLSYGWEARRTGFDRWMKLLVVSVASVGCSALCGPWAGYSYSIFSQSISCLCYDRELVLSLPKTNMQACKDSLGSQMIPLKNQEVNRQENHSQWALLASFL